MPRYKKDHAISVPKGNKVAVLYMKNMGEDNEEVVAVIARHEITGIFTLFINNGGVFEKIATKKTPDFKELDTLYT